MSFFQAVEHVQLYTWPASGNHLLMYDVTETKSSISVMLMCHRMLLCADDGHHVIIARLIFFLYGIFISYLYSCISELDVRMQT